MNKNALKTLIIILLFISNPLQAQEFDFDIHKISLKDCIKKEKELGSKETPLTTTYVSFKGEAQPFKFLRKEKKIPDLYVYYFFTKKDSILSYILYEWDVANFEKKRIIKKPVRFGKAFIRKYQKIKNLITEKYGKPKSLKKNYSNLAQYKQKLFFEENAVWQPNDSTEIELYITISNYYEKKGGMTISPIHRMRLYIRNLSIKNQQPSPKISQEKLAKLDSIVTDFYKALETKDLDKARSFLPDAIKDKVTDEQFTSLINSIDFTRKIELYYSGIKMTLDGNIFTMLLYKFTDNNSNPPNEMVRIIFDKQNKILAVQTLNNKPDTNNEENKN